MVDPHILENRPRGVWFAQAVAALASVPAGILFVAISEKLWLGYVGGNERIVFCAISSIVICMLWWGWSSWMIALPIGVIGWICARVSYTLLIRRWSTAD